MLPALLRLLCAIGLLTALALGLSGRAVAATGAFESQLAEGVRLREMGHLDLAIDQLRRAAGNADTDAQKMQAAGELGATLVQARHPDEALILLRQAHAMASGADRATYAMDLGNLAVLAKQDDLARRHYAEAQELAPPLAEDHAGLRIRAALNLARLTPAASQLAALEAIERDIGKGPPDLDRAPLYLNLGTQAQALKNPALAYRSLERARSLSARTEANRLQVEALDALAQLYENQSRPAESFELNQRALNQAGQLPASAISDLFIALEWRSARLHAVMGQQDLALAAYQRAADRVEALRPDVPIELDNGASSFRQLFEPVYMGLVETLLNAASAKPSAETDGYLRRARDAMELVKQSELQDYLGDRCEVDAIKGGTSTVIPPGTAVVYPIILKTHVELLVETSAGMARFTSPVEGETVRDSASKLATAFREARPGYQPRARELYDWLLRPLEGLVAAQRIDSLVLVPDGALRLVPFAALHDGQHFAIEKYAVSTVAGMSMTNASRPSFGNFDALMAGAATFGPVVGKLIALEKDQQLRTPVSDATPALPAAPSAPSGPAARGLRAIRALDAAQLRFLPESEQQRSMRDALALPGVTREISFVKQLLPGVSLLDADFTLNSFDRAATSGNYRIMHVASHGVFGGDASSSYLLAYDDLLTLDGLQALLKSDSFRKHPIELLSLSACETAEGNDRAPLGISGAAVKARARSVLGTLWPVNDDAAVRLMSSFYTGLTQGHKTKAQALRQAQLELIRNKDFEHPFYWAPFSLIGNWL